jgi:O-antigen/teichoic acid export membrane protein
MQSSSKIDKAARIAKTSSAMLATATRAKGGGLFLTVLVARYLGASSLGVFAVIQAMSLLLEVMLPLGQQDVLVRTIAREQSSMLNHWVNASMTSFGVAMGVGLSLVLVACLKDFGTETTVALCVAAAGFPFAGMNLVAQAVLQGAERMEYQTLAAFTGRLIGLLLLWFLLAKGAGIWAAFASRAIFKLASLLILSRAIWLRCWAAPSG